MPTGNQESGRRFHHSRRITKKERAALDALYTPLTGKLDLGPNQNDRDLQEEADERPDEFEIGS